MRVLGTPQSAHRPTLVRLAPVDARRAAQSRNSFRLQAEPEPTSQRTPPPDKGPPSDADNKAAEYVTWPAVNNPPPRRLILGSLTGAGIVLGGNLFGITGALLGTRPPPLAPTLAAMCSAQQVPAAIYLLPNLLLPQIAVRWRQRTTQSVAQSPALILQILHSPGGRPCAAQRSQTRPCPRTPHNHVV